MNHIESPDHTDRGIETEIQRRGLTAPRVTPADIAANIVSEHYFTAADGVDGADIGKLRAAVPSAALTVVPLTEDVKSDMSVIGPLRLLTFCVLTLRSGFTVTGESACASPENFDPEIGKRIARENAVQKVWPLMGYALKEELWLLGDPSLAPAKPRPAAIE